ncbi:MAG: hypothetical protein IBX64_07460 [Actinobacteria bacterium]|nr:hypothetical protein [Actinomycetota bacterium]
MGDDFFENQVEDTPSKSKAPNKNSKESSKSPENKTANSGTKAVIKTPVGAQLSEGLKLPQQVDIIWAIALIVVAFVIGFFARGVIMPPATTITSTDNMVTPAPRASGYEGAPPLSMEQLQSGKLPQGHPSIGGDTTQSGGESTTSPSGTGMGDIKNNVPASGPLQEDSQPVEAKKPNK